MKWARSTSSAVTALGSNGHSRPQFSMPRSRALAPERALTCSLETIAAPGPSVVVTLLTQLGTLSGLIATKALGSQVVPVLGTTECTSTPARYQTVSGGAKYCSASGS